MSIVKPKTYRRWGKERAKNRGDGPRRSQRERAFAEAWIATLRKKYLRWFMCFSLKHMDYIVQTFVD